MLRPTLNELISGMQRTIMEALMPELTSPYAQGRRCRRSRCSRTRRGLESAPAYDAAEIKDLRATFAALKRLGDKHIAKKADCAAGSPAPLARVRRIRRTVAR